MGDHSSATVFQVGDTVVVVDDVMKMGRNLRGLTGTVVETWEKCDVDPT
jgi:adenine/guanine phosphoribosyltransferase-like PRPP-binding protein